jgi:hypothetical protein
VSVWDDRVDVIALQTAEMTSVHRFMLVPGYGIQNGAFHPTIRCARRSDTGRTQSSARRMVFWPADGL